MTDQEKISEIIEIYTDGACSGNPGPGGWGAIIRKDEEEIELSGGSLETTNNRMEMMAAIASLETFEESVDLTLYTDSTYVKDGISKWILNWKANGWKTAAKAEVENVDLWKRLDALNAYHRITWKWVKGHSGHPLNDRADLLARNAIVREMMASDLES